ncbi:MAG: hypothetical protein METHAR1v1_700019 [Methanothrix sp.]|jgi:hypothetical protein|nr:MAG: hypothetical protein METHAR1v1_700019 [Methanothrix sp.]
MIYQGSCGTVEIALHGQIGYWELGCRLEKIPARTKGRRGEYDGRRTGEGERRRIGEYSRAGRHRRPLAFSDR